MSVISGCGFARSVPLAGLDLAAVILAQLLGRSLWPSISGVALRIRSIRAWTLGSIGWARAAAGRIASSMPATSKAFLNIMAKA